MILIVKKNLRFTERGFQYALRSTVKSVKIFFEFPGLMQVKELFRFKSMLIHTMTA